MSDGFVADDGFEEDAPPAPTKMSPGEVIKRAAVQGGTLRFGDEIGGAARAGRDIQVGQDVRTPGPLALAKLYPGVPYAQAAAKWFNENRPDLGAARSAEDARANQAFRYEVERDAIREKNAKAQQDHPWIYGAGEIAGGALPAALAAPAAGATTLGGRVLAGAQAAAPFGAAVGLGGSEATTPGGQMLDTFLGGTGAAAFGGALPLASAAISPIARKASDWLHAASINQGRKVLTGNAAPMATRKPLSDTAVDAAYNVGAIKPFGTVEKAAERLTTARDMAGDLYGQIVASLEAKGVTGPDALVLAQRLSQEANGIAAQSLGSPAPGAYRSIAEELTTKVNPASPRLGLTQAENMKRTLQRAASSEYVKEGAQSLSGEAKTDLASALRQAIEDEVTAQASKAPAEAAAFEPIKREVGALIEASKAADRAAARAANRQQFGLGSKVLAGGALASGSVPGAAAALVGSTLLRNRGPATAGALFRALSKASGAVADTTPQTVSRTARAASPTVADEVSTLIAMLRQYRPQLVPVAADEEQGP